MPDREARGGTLVLGGGFAGSYVARLLGKRGATIVSLENFMLYTPMLPEAASGTLEPRHVVVPLRMMCPYADLVLGRAVAHDAERRRVQVETGEGLVNLRYVNLVVALGAVSRRLPISGLAEYARGFKSLADAIDLRNHVLRRLETAAAAPNETHRERELTFVFVGAGYAGVEALAELSDLVRDALRYYPSLRETRQHWVLVDAAPKILPEIPRRLGDYAADQLAGRGVDGTLRVDGMQGVWALGDGARVPNAATPGEFDPPICQHALRQARRLAKNLHGEPRPYRYRMLGQVATLGRYKGSRTSWGSACAASRAGSSPARTTCTSSRSSRGSCASSPTGRPRSSSAATSPSSECSGTLSALATSEDLRRAYEFLARADMSGERTEPTRFGIAVYDDRVPKRYDSNYLLVDTVRPAATAEKLAADARAHGRPMIFFRDEQSAEPLLAGFRSLGWRLDRHVFMVQRGAPTRAAPVGLVQELDAGALRPARRRLIEDFPWASPEVLEQLHEAKHLIAARVDTRFLGIVVDGEVVAYADVYIEPPNAQIEDVGTLEAHRGRGYASAVVLRAAEEARRAGADFVFLVADAEDWPQHLYRRLGFEPIGRYVKLIAPGV